MLSVDSGSIPKDHSRWHKFQTSKSRVEMIEMILLVWTGFLAPKFFIKFHQKCACQDVAHHHRTGTTLFSRKKTSGDPQLHPLRKDSCTKGWLEIVVSNKNGLNELGSDRSVQLEWWDLFEKQPCWGHGHWMSNFEMYKNPDSPLILSLTSVSCCPTASYTCNCQAYVSQMVLRQVMS